ncbi:hypothetical protein AT6N2_C1682 [Agrobacterium tumefaciens]|nr:hypothetical protein AT6N2_C1682 [Agrobacterium tumefaciens]
MWDMSFTIKPAFACIVAVLQRNHDPFQLAQQQQGDEHRKRQPQQDMHPNGGRKMLIDPERQSDHQKSDDQHDEDRRPIPCIGEAIIQPAGATGGFYRQETIEKTAIAASRAAAFQTDLDGIDRGEISV